tara:strand:- start:1946 stop:2914 length:969 start_codon:yes stop_codon:yes gene_type:complete
MAFNNKKGISELKNSPIKRCSYDLNNPVIDPLFITSDEKHIGQLFLPYTRSLGGLTNMIDRAELTLYFMEFTGFYHNATTWDALDSTRFTNILINYCKNAGSHYQIYCNAHLKEIYNAMVIIYGKKKGEVTYKEYIKEQRIKFNMWFKNNRYKTLSKPLVNFDKGYLKDWQTRFEVLKQTHGDNWMNYFYQIVDYNEFGSYIQDTVKIVNVYEKLKVVFYSHFNIYLQKKGEINVVTVNKDRIEVRCFMIKDINKCIPATINERWDSAPGMIINDYSNGRMVSSIFKYSVNDTKNAIEKIGGKLVLIDVDTEEEIHHSLLLQ